MRIGIIGGIERNEGQYQAIAAGEGHDTIFHGGHMQGRGNATLESLVERSDVLVIITDVNSHGAVQIARKFARFYGRPHVLVRRCGTSRFRELVRELTVAQQGAA